MDGDDDRAGDDDGASGDNGAGDNSGANGADGAGTDNGAFDDDGADGKDGDVGDDAEVSDDEGAPAAEVEENEPAAVLPTTLRLNMGGPGVTGYTPDTANVTSGPATRTWTSATEVSTAVPDASPAAITPPSGGARSWPTRFPSRRAPTPCGAHADRRSEPGRLWYSRVPPLPPPFPPPPSLHPLGPLLCSVSVTARPHWAWGGALGRVRVPRAVDGESRRDAVLVGCKGGRGGRLSSRLHSRSPTSDSPTAWR